jgi:ubiquinone/menaquinone biosynthesis C-methylase UbiE
MRLGIAHAAVEKWIEPSALSSNGCCLRSVLEIGCGTGHFARWFASRLSFAVGLDRAPAMLAELQKVSRGMPLVLGGCSSVAYP